MFAVADPESACPDMFGVVPGLRIKSLHGYVLVAFSECFMQNDVNQGWTMGMSFHYSTSLLDNSCLFTVAIASINKFVCK